MSAPTCCGLAMYFDIYGGGHVCLDCGSGTKAPAREEQALGYREPTTRAGRIIEAEDAREYELANPLREMR